MHAQAKGNVIVEGTYRSPAFDAVMASAHRRIEIDICSRCCTTIPHPLLVAGSLILHGKTVRKFLPWVERLVYFSKLPSTLLKPPKKAAPANELVQIDRK